MILTNKQEEGLKIAVARYHAREKYTVISGYAGSGKTTLVRFIVDALNVDESSVCYVAYTGKAANVLKEKGCQNATTAHKLLYYATPTKTGSFIFKPKKSLEYEIIVVDEVSMLPKQMWELLIKYNVYIIALGDPAQLSPIIAEEDNHLLDKPHVFLDEIMRQAKDSEIIRLSMFIREHHPIASYIGEKEQVMIMSKQEVTDSVINWGDQILCATNKKRFELNNTCRRLKGYGEEPQVGDKIIGLSNHWDYFSELGTPLTNGTILTINGFFKTEEFYPKHIANVRVPILKTDANTDYNDTFWEIPIDYNTIKNGKKTLSPYEEYKVRKSEKYILPFEFAYGYAITVWKAQGSQWPKVLLFEEGHPFEAEEHYRYLYTGCTRAEQKLVIVRK